MRRVGAALAMTVAMAGCGPDLGPLNEARARWQASGPASYRYTFAVVGAPAGLASEVTVDAGVVAEVTVSTNSAVLYTLFAHGLTVEGLLDDVEARLRTSCAVEASFDPRLGYPLRAFSTCEWNSQGWTVNGFQSL